MNSSRIEKCGQGRPDRDSPIYDPDGQKADQSTVTNHQPSHQLYNFLSIFSFSLSLSLSLSFFLSLPDLLSFLFFFFSFVLCVSLFGISDNFHSTNWLLRTIISNITRAFFLYHYIVLSFYNPPWDSDISLSYTTRAKKERKVENKEVFRDSFQSLRSSLRFCVSVSVCISYFKHASSLSFFFSFFLFLFLLFFSFVVHQRNRMPWTER